MITLFQIVEAIDGDEIMKACVLGFPSCSERNACALHAKWSELREGIQDMLKSRNIAEMARDMKRSKYRGIF